MILLRYRSDRPGRYRSRFWVSWIMVTGMDSSMLNHTFRLATRPTGLPKPSDWTYAEEQVPELEDGQMLVKVLYISLDPAMRGWMNEGKSYIPPVGIGEVMRAGAAG